MGWDTEGWPRPVTEDLLCPDIVLNALHMLSFNFSHFIVDKTDSADVESQHT